MHLKWISGLSIYNAKTSHATTNGMSDSGWRRDIIALSAITGILLLGCSGNVEQGPARAKVSGLVKFQGQPLPFGTILFVPEAGSGLPISSTKILDGRYAADAIGGVPVGKHQVEITGWNQSPDHVQPTDVKDGGSAQLVPAKYNSQSTLKLIIDSTKAVQKDFDLN